MVQEKNIYLNYKTEFILKENLEESDENGYYKLTDSLDINIDFCVYCGRKFIVELKYVKQLEDFYYILTGKKLIIHEKINKCDYE